MLSGSDAATARQRNAVIVLFADSRPAGEAWLQALQRASGGLVLCDDAEWGLRERDQSFGEAFMRTPTTSVRHAMKRL